MHILAFLAGHNLYRNICVYMMHVQTWLHSPPSPSACVVCSLFPLFVCFVCPLPCSCVLFFPLFTPHICPIPVFLDFVCPLHLCELHFLWFIISVDVLLWYFLMKYGWSLVPAFCVLLCIILRFVFVFCVLYCVVFCVLDIFFLFGGRLRFCLGMKYW